MNIDYKRCLQSIIIIIISFIIAKVYSNYSRKKEKENKDLINYELNNIIYYIILTAGIILALFNLQIQTSTLLTVLGSAGIAIALSLQTMLTNITSGLYIGCNNLYKIGDMIQITSPSGQLYKGNVSSFNLFNTTITDNKNSIIIPNTMIQSNIIVL
jgi:small conductance mechanosensitive channel